MIERLLNLFIIIILLIRSDATMARGHPDFGVLGYSFFAVETPISDVVAERQGFSRLDNRGRVLWIDDFRGGLNRWELFSDNGGTNPIHIFQNPFGLGYNGSVKIDSLVNTGISDMFTRLVMPVSKRLSIEVSLYLPTNFAQVQILLAHDFSVGQNKGANLFIKPTTGEIVLFNGAGEHSVFTPSSIAYFTNRWIVIKMVADFSIGNYARVMVGNTQYDFDTLALDSGIAGLAGATQIEIFTEGTSATNKEEIYVGYVIVSGDEP